MFSGLREPADPSSLSKGMSEEAHWDGDCENLSLPSRRLPFFSVIIPMPPFLTFPSNYLRITLFLSTCGVPRKPKFTSDVPYLFLVIVFLLHLRNELVFLREINILEKLLIFLRIYLELRRFYKLTKYDHFFKVPYRVFGKSHYNKWCIVRELVRSHKRMAGEHQTKDL